MSDAVGVGDISVGSGRKIQAFVSSALGAFSRGEVEEAREDFKEALRIVIRREFDNVSLVDEISVLLTKLGETIGDSGDLPEGLIGPMVNLTIDLKNRLNRSELKSFERKIINGLSSLLINDPEDANENFEDAKAILEGVSSDVSSEIAQMQTYIDQVKNFFGL